MPRRPRSNSDHEAWGSEGMGFNHQGDAKDSALQGGLAEGATKCAGLQTLIFTSRKK